jgi:CheY-like chemotaxis protein
MLLSNRLTVNVMKQYDCNILVNRQPDITLPAFNWKDKKILIVEDDYANYLFLCEMLSCAGAFLMHAVSLQEAFDLISLQPEYDLLIINTAIPGNANCKAIHRLKLYWPFLTVVAVACHECKARKKKCFPSGCDTLISFNVDRNELMAIVNEMFYPEG